MVIFPTEDTSQILGAVSGLFVQCERVLKILSVLVTKTQSDG